MKTLEAWRVFEESGFFDWMRQRLEQAKEKYQNQKLEKIEYVELLDHLREEVAELTWVFDWGNNFDKANELADVANMCGFVYAKIKQLNE